MEIGGLPLGLLSTTPENSLDFDSVPRNEVSLLSQIPQHSPPPHSHTFHDQAKPPHLRLVTLWSLPPCPPPPHSLPVSQPPHLLLVSPCSSLPPPPLPSHQLQLTCTPPTLSFYIKCVDDSHTVVCRVVNEVLYFHGSTSTEALTLACQVSFHNLPTHNNGSSIQAFCKEGRIAEFDIC